MIVGGMFGPRACLVVVVVALVLIGACKTTPKTHPQPRTKTQEKVHRRTRHAERVPSAEAYSAVIASQLLLEDGNTIGARGRIEEALLSDPQSPYLHTQLGELRLAAGDIDGAGNAASAALALESRSVPALRLLARARELQSDVNAAKRLYRRALSIAPGDRDSSTGLAEIFLKADDVRAAEGVIEAMMAREPNATDGYVTLAQLFADRGQLDDAKRHISAALVRDARNLDALELNRNIAEAKGDFNVALGATQRIVRERGDSRRSRHLLLRALLLNGDHETAATLVTSWLLDDDSDTMLLLIADAMENAGERVGARTLLRERGGESPLMRAERGRIAYDDHDFESARSLLCAVASELDDEWRDFAFSLCLRALAMVNKRPMAMALVRSEFEKANASVRVLRAATYLAELDDDAGFTRELLAVFDGQRKANPAANDLVSAHILALEKLGDPRQARQALDAALRERPNDPQRRVLLAHHLERQGDAIASIAVVEALFLTRDPTEAQLNFLAFTLADNALRPSDAVGYAWRALVRSPTSGYILDTLGWAQLHAGDLDGAVKHLQRAARLSPKEPEILLHLALVYVAKKDRARARTVARESLLWVTLGDPILERIEALLLTLDEEPS